MSTNRATYITVVIVPALFVGCEEAAVDSVSDSRNEIAMDEYQHPKLGPLYQEDVDWQSDESSVSFYDDKIQVCLAEGTDAGPSEKAMRGYEWMEGHWSHVLEIIQEQAFAYYQPMAEADNRIPKIDSPSQLWGTEILLAIRVFSEDDFAVTMRFGWQDNSDPHEITFYVEGGTCNTHSVDG